MREWDPTPLSQIRNQPKSGYINPKIVSTMNTSIWHHIWTILEFFSIFRLQRTKNWPKKNFQKSHCTLRDTPKRYQWSKFGVFRTFRNPESTFGVILRYCAICAKNQFLSFFFGQNRVKTFILGMNSSTKQGGYILPPPLTHSRQKFFRVVSNGPYPPLPSLRISYQESEHGLIKLKHG